jgi:hypothetical protein
LLLQRLEFAQQRVELGVGDDGGVFDVIAELVCTHLVGQFLPAAAQIGIGRVFGLLGQRLLRLGCLRAHPRRLSEHCDIETGRTGCDHLRV